MSSILVKGTFRRYLFGSEGSIKRIQFFLYVIMCVGPLLDVVQGLFQARVVQPLVKMFTIFGDSSRMFGGDAAVRKGDSVKQLTSKIFLKFYIQV